MKTTTHIYKSADSFKPLDLADDSVQLVVTSPPYPMVEMWDNVWATDNPKSTKALAAADGAKAYELMHQSLDKTWQEMYRVLAPGGFACINIGDATRSLNGRFSIWHNHSRVSSACLKAGFDMLPSIIWRKPTNAPNKFMGSGMLPAGAYVTLEHEYILIMRKGEKRTFSAAEKKIRSESAIFWEERNSWYTDLWTDVLGRKQEAGLKSDRKRSAAYPIDIPYRLIMMYSMAGDTVLDPFAGTGTTALAAMTTGRNSCSYDTDEKLIESSSMIPTQRSTKSVLNKILEDRLTNHMAHVADKDMLFFRYRNEALGIPVKTLQEKKLNIYPIKSISRTDATIQVKYRKLKATEIKKSLGIKS